jgi:regulatory protein
VRSSEPSTPERAYLCALRLLNARDYTEARLRERLRSRGFEETDLETALARLVSEGWVNDLRFAERFAASALDSGRFYGPRLRLEMRRRGLPPELVSTVLGHALGERDEAGEVRALLERRFGGFSFSSASDRDKRRTVAFLQRRGYSLSIILNVLRTQGDT